MRAIKYTLAMLLALAAAGFAGAQGLSITQIGTERLLSSQETRLYLATPPLATDPATGAPSLEVWESGDGVDYDPRPITGLSSTENADEGIRFFLLVDNSGSMWTDMAGADTDDLAALRVERAKTAARAFLAELSAKDTVGMAVFNTRYWSAVPPGGQANEAARALDELSKPAPADAYTELYLSMERALESFALEPGRRVLIVLSDGENFPYAQMSGKPNPETGTRQTTPEAVIERAVRDGVTIYAVRFGAQKDPRLGDTAEGSGGRAFDAMNENELTSIYRTIRADVLSELALDYKAGMERGEKRWVKVEALSADGRRLTAVRHYYAGTILGQNTVRPELWYLFLIAAAFLLWLALVLLRLERETDKAGVRLLFGTHGQQTRFFEIAGPQTVIGAAPDADVSIAGNPSLKSSHATILFDEAKDAYTVVSDTPITVNNKEATRRRLESGDVLNLAGTVVVFDDSLLKKAKAMRARIKTRKYSSRPDRR